MARTIWKGALSFGLVSVPVGIYAATQDKSIHFNQFEKGTSDRIRYKKVNERTGNEVDSANIVKGVDVGGGSYVMLTDAELAAAEPTKSRSIEITDFVDLEAIDPVFAVMKAALLDSTQCVDLRQHSRSSPQRAHQLQALRGAALRDDPSQLDEHPLGRDPAQRIRVGTRARHRLRVRLEVQLDCEAHETQHA